ncbi:MAG: hypothetical protein MJ000_11485 [Bacteroidales bacterium]|nr:hypothetical protein [Bacteroidales bacterium]
MKTRRKRIRDMMCAAALLLALTVPPSAYGQSDGFFSNVNGARVGGDSWNGMNGGGNGGYWNGMNGGGNGGSNGGSWNGINGGGNGGSWNDINGGGGGAAWNGMEDETPVGGGLLVLTAAGACYAGVKKFRNSKIRQSKA